jgi:hypothetical protein
MSRRGRSALGHQLLRIVANKEMVVMDEIDVYKSEK